ncbi:hypothetical protein FJU08_06825 [Martelella alba]|uniref:Uncharacterized protein n=1 Tax=Martelella alba TaxID=2590451 RepID=A0A506UDI3_9HYPH|nr:hypothetical protein [Martelella alba]TPW31466.1 hypothetical protein FJU08_06825 [Martelella alba]
MSTDDNWEALESSISELISKFPRDEFLEALLVGTWRVAIDADNPIRGNLIASALREVIGHVLHKLAPDESVRACVWFKQTQGTTTVTRRQRATFIIQAGLPDDFVNNTIGFDVRDQIDPLLEAFDELSKFTHVRAETIVHEHDEVQDIMVGVVDGLLAILKAADDAQDDLKNAIVEVMQGAMLDKLISETIQDLDELSTHTSVSGQYVESIEIVDLDEAQITYEVIGEVEVDLQYGSNSDVRKGLGHVMGDSYPYSAFITARAAKPFEIKNEDVELRVDNSSFFE